MTTIESVDFAVGDLLRVTQDCNARDPGTQFTDVFIKEGERCVFLGDPPSGHPAFGLIRVHTSGHLSTELELNYKFLERVKE